MVGSASSSVGLGEAGGLLLNLLPWEESLHVRTGVKGKASELQLLGAEHRDHIDISSHRTSRVLEMLCPLM